MVGGAFQWRLCNDLPDNLRLIQSLNFLNPTLKHIFLKPHLKTTSRVFYNVFIIIIFYLFTVIIVLQFFSYFLLSYNIFYYLFIILFIADKFSLWTRIFLRSFS